MPSLPATYTDIHTILLAQPDLATMTDPPVLPASIEAAAGEAEAEINGHIARLYALPIGVDVPLLTTLATDIAIYKIFTSRPFTAPPRPIETAWLDRYKAAVAMLLRIAAGEMLLVGANGTIITTSSEFGGAWSNTMAYTPTFGEGADQGFTVDRAKIENEAARRVP